jgi:hypothetical protein
VEAFSFMHRSHRLGYLAYPLLCFLLLAASQLRAQDATPPAQQTAPPSDVPPQAAPVQDQSPEQRAKVLREAQARVRARRQRRTAQVVQDTYSHKFELYFGGGYLRFRPGHSLQHATEGGWNVGVTDYFGPRLGVTADFRGYYGTAYTGNNLIAIHNPSISQYTFLAGPQYRIVKGPRLAVSAQVLGGAGHGNFDTGIGGFPASLIGLYPNATVFNVSAGVPIDYNLGPGLAIRVTPTYLLTDYGSELQHNKGFTMGIVYRFGRQK